MKTFLFAASLVLLCGATATVRAFQQLPAVSVDAGAITVSGLSSGADMTVQLQVAFSSVFSGSGVFAGQPYRCAVHAFPDDTFTPPNPSVPVCDGCPPHTTLVYDHCKNHPQVVVPKALTAEILGYSGDQVDDTANLKHARVYLYRGVHDATYLSGAVANVRDMLAPLMADPDTQILFNNTTPSQHCWPTLDTGVPCGAAGPIEACNYSGPAACLAHIYNTTLRPRVLFDDGRLVEFDQGPFADPTQTGFAPSGYYYWPTGCGKPSQRPCRLHVSLHGCSEYEYYTEATRHLFNELAEANDVFMVYPRIQPWGTTVQQQSGCWDAYAQTGANYAWRDGVQMQGVRNMVRVVAGV